MLSQSFRFPKLLSGLTSGWAAYQKVEFEAENPRNTLVKLLEQKLQQESKGKFNIYTVFFPTTVAKWQVSIAGWGFKHSQKKNTHMQELFRTVVLARNQELLLQFFARFKSLALEGLRKDLSEITAGATNVNTEAMANVLKGLETNNKYLQVALFINYCVVTFERYEIHPGFLRDYLNKVTQLVIFDSEVVSDPEQLTKSLVLNIETYGLEDLISFYKFLPTSGATKQGKVFHEVYIRYGEPKLDQVSTVPFEERRLRWRRAKGAWDFERTFVIDHLVKIKAYIETNKDSKKDLAINFARREFKELQYIFAKILKESQGLLDTIVEFEPSREEKNRYSWVKTPDKNELIQLRSTLKVLGELSTWLDSECDSLGGVQRLSEVQLLLMEALTVRLYHLVKGLYNLEER